MIDGWNFFDNVEKNDFRTYDKIWKVVAVQGDDYTNGCLLDYPCLEKYYKLITIDLSKQQNLDADPKVIQQTNFTRNLKEDNSTVFFIIEESKITVLNFSKWTMRVL